MKRQAAFNHLFTLGSDYSTYVETSDRHHERMKQAYETADSYIKQVDEALLERCNTTMKVLCIAESWCGDCANSVPVIAKLAEIMDKWQFTISERDEYGEIVDEFYTTAGRRKVPVLVFADRDGDEIGRWVERPTESYKLLVDLQAKKLPKEEYIEEYRSHPLLRPPLVVENAINEIVQVALKSSSLNLILPKKGKK